MAVPPSYLLSLFSPWLWILSALAVFQGRTESWWAVRWLQSVSPAHNWHFWSSPYSLSMVVLAYTGSVIEQQILDNSTLQTLLSPKSNPLEGHIEFPGPSALLTKHTQNPEPKQFHRWASVCLRQGYFPYALWDFIPFYRTRRFWLGRAISISTASGINYPGG